MSQRQPKLPKLRITAIMTSKGQLTIPKYLRDKLGITPGTRLEIQPVAEEHFIATLISRPKQLKP